MLHFMVMLMLTQLFVLQTNELYQLASVAFCLLVAWVCLFLQSYFLRYILAYSLHIMICTIWVRETSLFTLLLKLLIHSMKHRSIYFVSLNDSVNCQAEIETHVQPWFLSLRIVTLIYLFILIGQLNTLKS